MQDRCRLYIISPEKIDLHSFRKELKSAFAGGDVAVFQLRLKNVQGSEIKRAVKELLPICRDAGVPLILNDYIDLAVETGADGVHLGQEDGPEQEGFTEGLREKVGDDFIIGVSCYGSKHYAMVAAEEGADYVAFGAFYPTKTKTPKARPDPEILEWWNTYTNVPCVAIGGIRPENCEILVKSGANFLAAVSAIWQNPLGPEEAVRQFNEAIQTAIA